MNDLIRSVAEQGQSMTYYGAICDAGLYIALAYSLFHATKLKIKFWKVTIIIALTYGWQVGLQSAFWPILQYIRDTHFLGISSAVNSIVRTFVFLPIIAFPLAKIFKYKFGHVCDAIVMLPLLRSAIAQIACLFPGCCRGFQCDWGVYNIQTGQYHFPTPILETVLTLIIFAILVGYTIKNKFVSDGKLYPLMMLMYGPMRYICELLRDNQRIFLGSSAVGLHALIITVVGLVWFYLIYRKENKVEKKDEEVTEDAEIATAESNAAEETPEA